MEEFFGITLCLVFIVGSYVGPCGADLEVDIDHRELSWEEATKSCKTKGYGLFDPYKDNTNTVSSWGLKEGQLYWTTIYQLQSPFYWKFGCFGVDDRTQLQTIDLGNSNGISECSRKCKDCEYIGLEENFCHCFPDSPTLTQESKVPCTTPCPGNNDNICGERGTSKISVYRKLNKTEDLVPLDGTDGDCVTLNKEDMEAAYDDYYDYSEFKVFTDMNCSIIKSFFCKNYNHDPNDSDSRLFIYYSKEVTWAQAQQECFKDGHDMAYIDGTNSKRVLTFDEFPDGTESWIGLFRSTYELSVNKDTIDETPVLCKTVKKKGNLLEYGFEQCHETFRSICTKEIRTSGLTTEETTVGVAEKTETTVGVAETTETTTEIAETTETTTAVAETTATTTAVVETTETTGGVAETTETTTEVAETTKTTTEVAKTTETTMGVAETTATTTEGAETTLTEKQKMVTVPEKVETTEVTSVMPPITSEAKTETTIALVPPVIGTVPQDQEVSIGDTVTIQCTATGVPPPQIYWRHLHSPSGSVNQNNFTQGTVNGRFSVDIFGTLTIRDIKEEDGGDYQCNMENNAGLRTITIELNIVVPTAVPIKPLVMDTPTESTTTNMETTEFLEPVIANVAEKNIGKDDGHPKYKYQPSSLVLVLIALAVIFLIAVILLAFAYKKYRKNRRYQNVSLTMVKAYPATDNGTVAIVTPGKGSPKSPPKKPARTTSLKQDQPRLSYDKVLLDVSNGNFVSQNDQFVPGTRDDISWNLPFIDASRDNLDAIDETKPVIVRRTITLSEADAENPDLGQTNASFDVSQAEGEPVLSTEQEPEPTETDKMLDDKEKETNDDNVFDENAACLPRSPSEHIDLLFRMSLSGEKE